MKKMLKISALSLCAILTASAATFSAGAVNVSTVNIQQLCNSSNCVALAKSDCNALDSIDINSLVAQCGSNSADIRELVSKGSCNSEDIKNLVANGTCTADDLQSLVQKCGVLPDDTQCVTGQNQTTTQTTAPSTVVTQPSTNTNTSDTTQASGVSDYEQQVIDLVNEQRAAYGLSPLTLNTELSRVARIKAEDMRDNGYFSHTSPTYGSPFDMMKSFGISYNTAGENIAMGQQTPQAVVTAWMNSEGHRANILNASFTQIGVGYASNGNYWSQMFIG